MDRFLIHGGVPLRGEVTISGAKNAVLPIMAAALLTEEPCVIRRVPDLSDVRFMGRILESLGASVTFEAGTLTIQARQIQGYGDYDLIRKMRGSICIMGPLLGRLHEAKVALPGGCAIGVRPIDLHLKGFRALGVNLDIAGGYVHATAARLAGTELFLGGRAGPTVLGTANLMMAATLADGITVIDSAACEPEVVDLADFLISMGAKISGAGSPRITVTGVKTLHGADHEVIPDRIEAATFAIAAVATNGEVTLQGARADHMQAVIDKLREAGALLERKGPALIARRGPSLRPVDVTTQPYAGFPTDVQAQIMVLMTIAPGTSIITERIFESRFMHAAELARLGADIAIEGPSAIVKGVPSLSGAEMMAGDLRASAALVIAGLAASGSTEILRVYHIDRGYENIDLKLRQLGARFERLKANPNAPENTGGE
ncbi:MAG: UDP-N-acetylglucosamine 1-carboxyvinyltransferase [Verrucomicrobia bacterium]|nr:UDP-N-acetylglucosamine 1-carboxyvinyltransferase [Verrucomicrobiota bacterium]